MASLTIADNILEQIRDFVGERLGEASEQNISLIETIQGSVLSLDDIGTKVKDAAEEEAAAITKKEKEDAKRASEALAEEIRNRNVLSRMAHSIASGLGQLKDSIKDDFSFLSGEMSALQQIPGFKTIKLLLTMIAGFLAKIVLKLLTKKFFSGLVGTDDKGQFDVKKTLGNFKDWGKGLVGLGPKKDRLNVKDRRWKDRPRSERRERTEKLKQLKKERAGEKGPGVFENMKQGMSDMANKAGKKFASMKASFGNAVGRMGNSLKNLGQSLWKSMKGAPQKALALFQKASMAMVGTFKRMGAAMMKHVKKMVVPLASFIMASLAYIATMIASAIAMIAPAIPIILIVLAIGLLVAGLIWLGIKIAENWEQIKERFGIAFEQLSIWAAQAALWLGGALAPLRDKLAMFFASILDGIASMLNSAIGWINEQQPAWLKRVRGNKELISFSMEEGHVETAQAEAQLRQSDRDAAGAELEERQAALDARKAAYDAAAADPRGFDEASNNAVVVNNQSTSQHHANRTEPTDGYAGGAALAQ